MATTVDAEDEAVVGYDVVGEVVAVELVVEDIGAGEDAGGDDAVGEGVVEEDVARQVPRCVCFLRIPVPLLTACTSLCVFFPIPALPWGTTPWGRRHWGRRHGGRRRGGRRRGGGRRGGGRRRASSSFCVCVCFLCELEEELWKGEAFAFATDLPFNLISS